MRYLEISNITNVALSEVLSDRKVEPAAGHTCIDVTDQPTAHIGDVYNPKSGRFTTPPPPPVRILTSREFIRRFTDAEIAQYETLTVAATQQGAQLRAAKTVLNAAPIVDLDHLDTIKYLGFMKDAGIITQRRIAEILA